MNSFFQFIRSALSDGLDDNASTRRLLLTWFGWLGGVALLFGLGFATGILIDFDPKERLDYFKYTLDWVYYLFATGLGAFSVTYGVTRMAEIKAKGGAKDEKPAE